MKKFNESIIHDVLSGLHTRDMYMDSYSFDSKKPYIIICKRDKNNRWIDIKYQLPSWIQFLAKDHADDKLRQYKHKLKEMLGIE